LIPAELSALIVPLIAFAVGFGARYMTERRSGDNPQQAALDALRAMLGQTGTPITPTAPVTPVIVPVTPAPPPDPSGLLAMLLANPQALTFLQNLLHASPAQRPPTTP
jgi:hypothetical protein